MSGKTKVIAAVQTPVLWLYSGSDPQGSVVCRFWFNSENWNELHLFLSDSGNDRRSDLVTTVPWASVLWNTFMSFPLLFPICPHRSTYRRLSLVSQRFSFFSSVFFLLIIFSLPSLLLFPDSPCVFDVSGPLTRTHSGLSTAWMFMAFQHFACMHLILQMLHIYVSEQSHGSSMYSCRGIFLVSSLKNKRKCSCLHLYFTQHTSIDKLYVI